MKCWSVNDLIFDGEDNSEKELFERYTIYQSKIFNVVNQYFPGEISQLIEFILKLNAEDRPTVEQLSRHPLVAPNFVEYRGNNDLIRQYKPVYTQLSVQSYVDAWINKLSQETQPLAKPAFGNGLKKRYKDMYRKYYASAIFFTIDTFYRYLDLSHSESDIDEIFISCLAIGTTIVGDSIFDEEYEPYTGRILRLLNGFYVYCPIFFDHASSLDGLKTGFKIIRNIELYRNYKPKYDFAVKSTREYFLSDLLT